MNQDAKIKASDLEAEYNDIAGDAGKVDFIADKFAQYKELAEHNHAVKKAAKEAERKLEQPEKAQLDEQKEIGKFLLPFLEMRELKPDTPESVLEQLIEIEQVNKFQNGVEELKSKRLATGPASNKRTFALFLPGSDEVLAFVNIFLSAQGNGRTAKDNEFVQSLDRVLETDTTDVAFYNTATPYGVSVARINGGANKLSGVGGTLIRKMAEIVKEDNPNAEIVTLSPSHYQRERGGKCWLVDLLKKGDDSIFNDQQREDILRIAKGKSLVPDTEQNACSALSSILEKKPSYFCKESRRTVNDALRGLVAIYTLCAKDGKRATDAVANFHINDRGSGKGGAYVANIVPQARGDDWGVMINYKYTPLDKAAERANGYREQGQIVTSPGLMFFLEGMRDVISAMFPDVVGKTTSICEDFGIVAPAHLKFQAGIKAEKSAEAEGRGA